MDLARLDLWIHSLTKYLGKLLATVRIVLKETPPYLQLKHFFKVNKTCISYTLILIPQQLYGWYIFPHQPWEVVKLSKDF